MTAAIAKKNIRLIGVSCAWIRQAENTLWIGHERSDYKISDTLKTNPGRTGSPLIVAGFSKHSTGCLGR